jgi:hypothetical protein
MAALQEGGVPAEVLDELQRLSLVPQLRARDPVTKVLMG